MLAVLKKENKEFSLINRGIDLQEVSMMSARDGIVAGDTGIFFMEKKKDELKGLLPMKSIVVVFSYHHKNTEKVAQVIAKVLNAPVKTPQQVHLKSFRSMTWLDLVPESIQQNTTDPSLTLPINSRG